MDIGWQLIWGWGLCHRWPLSFYFYGHRWPAICYAMGCLSLRVVDMPARVWYIILHEAYSTGKGSDVVLLLALHINTYPSHYRIICLLPSCLGLLSYHHGLKQKRFIAVKDNGNKVVHVQNVRQIYMGKLIVP